MDGGDWASAAAVVVALAALCVSWWYGSTQAAAARRSAAAAESALAVSRTDSALTAEQTRNSMRERHDSIAPRFDLTVHAPRDGVWPIEITAASAPGVVTGHVDADGLASYAGGSALTLRERQALPRDFVTAASTIVRIPFERMHGDGYTVSDVVYMELTLTVTTTSPDNRHEDIPWTWARSVRWGSDPREED